MMWFNGVLTITGDNEKVPALGTLLPTFVTGIRQKYVCEFGGL